MILGAPSCQQEFRFDQRKKITPPDLLLEIVHITSRTKIWRINREEIPSQLG